MKRALLLLLVLLLAMPAVTFAAPRTTTVMIYMCGSDLESRHGAASADIAEMLASGFDTSAVNVILMLGGSTEWELGFDPEVLTIAEIGRRGLRTVQTMDAMDMGDPATLKLFVEIAREQCPADRYALILWDHGGGPSGGVCFDEVAASGNAITPREIHIALNAVSPKIRFDWIGFDACLMASLETAFYLVDNADYMIASEESEPGSGWDYAFLKDLPNDRNGADTGRRVVEYFAAGGENSRDVYTMSCIDLNRVERLANLFNTYFSALADTLDADSYPVISNARHDGGSFGRTIYDDSLDYDLVDLGTFITACGGDNAALLDCLNEAVVCSGGNSEYATGLTVYHPYYNKAGNGRRYTDEVGVNLKGYQRYLKRFSGFLNGAPMTDWSNIETVYVGTDENGDAVFSATLTDEQVENFAEASLYDVTQSLFQHGELSSAMYCLWRQPEVTLEGNTLTAVMPMKTLQVVDADTGEILVDNVNYRPVREGGLMVYVFFEPSNISEHMRGYYYLLNPNETTGEAEITAVYDPDTLLGGRFSQRLALTRDEVEEPGKWTTANFAQRELNPVRVNGALAAYDDWEDAVGLTYDRIRLPRNWAFRIGTAQYSDGKWVTFQITDTQNNVHSTELTLLDSNSQIDLPPSDTLTVKGTEFTLHAFFYPERNRAGFRLEVAGDTRGAKRVEISDICINGADFYRYGYYAANGLPIQFAFTRDKADYISEINEISCTVTLKSEDVYDDSHIIEKIPLTFTFDTPIVFERARTDGVLASAEADGLLWELVELNSTDMGATHVKLAVTNDTDADIEPCALGLRFNDCAMGSLRLEEGIPAHGGALVETDLYSRLIYRHADGSERLCEDLGGYYGIDAVETVTLTDANGCDIRLTLDEPVKYTAYDNTYTGAALVLAEGETDVRLQDVIIVRTEAGVGAVVLALDITNNTDQPRTFTLVGSSWNGVSGSDAAESVTLGAGERRFCLMETAIDRCTETLSTYGAILTDGTTNIPVNIAFTAVANGVCPRNGYALTDGAEMPKGKGLQPLSKTGR